MWCCATFDARGLRAIICALAAAVSLASADASAQCGAKHSTCSGCHDGSKATLPGHDPWHDDHAFADLCPSCHGGRANAQDAATAHENLAEPLADPGSTCASCHGADTEPFATRYRNLRSTDAGAASIAPTTSSNLFAAHGERGPNVTMTILLVAVGALGAIVIGMRERDRNQTTKQGDS